MKSLYVFLSIIGLMLIVAVIMIVGMNPKKKIDDEVIIINYIYALSDNEFNQDKFSKLIKEYEKENPNVKINSIFVGSQIEAMIKTVSIQKNTNSIDFAILNNSELYTLQNMDLIVPLDDMIMKNYGLQLIEEYQPVFMENSIYNGYIWSIPFKRDVMLMYCNTQQLKETGISNGLPPQSWEQLYEYSRHLTVKEADRVTRYGVGMPLENDNLLFQTIASQLNDNSTYQPAKGTKYILDNNVNANAFKILNNIALANKYTTREIFNVEDVYEMFINQKASIIFAPSTLENQIKDKADFDLSVSPLPMNGYTVTSGMNLYVMSGKTEEKYKYIYDFISWIIRPDIYQKWINATGFFPVTKYLESPQKNLVRNNEIVSEPCVFENSKIDKIVNDAILNVVYHKKDSYTEIYQAEIEIEKILQSYLR